MIVRGIMTFLPQTTPESSESFSLARLHFRRSWPRSPRTRVVCEDPLQRSAVTASVLRTEAVITRFTTGAQKSASPGLISSRYTSVAAVIGTNRELIQSCATQLSHFNLPGHSWNSVEARDGTGKVKRGSSTSPCNLVNALPSPWV